jgi:hypothetical protein
MEHGGTGHLLIVSHLRLRRIIGALGLALPVVLLVWGFALSGWNLTVQNSLSDYYSLRTRDAFVGILFVIAWFLCAYKGYEVIDDVLGNLACILALGVAFFPNSGAGWERIVHFSCAGGLFVVLSFFSLYLFTKSENSAKGWRRTITSFHFRAVREGDIVTPQKKIRNRVYIACGIVMVLCLILIGLYSWLGQNTAISRFKPVFALEWILIWAFGISWMIKGETLGRDKKPIKARLAEV